jgi:hypothetical protein
MEPVTQVFSGIIRYDAAEHAELVRISIYFRLQIATKTLSFHLRQSQRTLLMIQL